MVLEGVPTSQLMVLLVASYVAVPWLVFMLSTLPAGIVKPVPMGSVTLASCTAALMLPAISVKIFLSSSGFSVDFAWLLGSVAH